MATTKKQIGRPTKRSPEPINPTPQELGEAFLNVPPDHQWGYLTYGKKEGAPK